MSKQYGSYDNPVRRLPDNTKREKLIECPKICGYNPLDTAPDLTKVRGSEQYSDTEQTFLLNLICNQQLSANALRIGSFLYISTEGFIEDEVFDLSEPDRAFKDKCLSDGTADGFIYFVTASSFQFSESTYERPKHLLSLLTKVGIELNRQELIEGLIELHEYYYITATDVCYENSVDSYRESKRIKKLDHDTNIVHIHFTQPMLTKAFTNKWRPSKQRNSTP